MIRRRLSYFVIVAFVILLLLLLRTNRRPSQVKVDVTVDPNDQLLISIKNPTAHEILFDDPRVHSSFSQFDWELFSGQDIVLDSKQTHVEINPLMPFHFALADIEPHRSFQRALTNYYSELGDRGYLQKADTFLWYCRLWDQTAARWIVATGAVQLHNGNK